MWKIKGINHISFAVKDLDEAIESAVRNMGGELMMKFESVTDKYIGACIALGEHVISYIQATDESSFVAQHIEKKGVGPQHMGITVENLEEYVTHLESQGVRVDKSQLGNETFKEALVGPKFGQGLVLQLMEWKGGTIDLSPEGRELLNRKYQEEPGLRFIETDSE